MAISFVASADFEINGVAETTVETTIPPGIQAGDLLFAAYGNVGNPRADVDTNPTPLNGWTLIDNVTTTDNCYLLIMAKEADAGDVADAGSTVSIAELPGDNGTTFRVCPCAAYRGVNAGDWFGDFNLNHVPSPGGTDTVSSGSVTNTDTDNWYICVWGAATGSGGGPGSWTSTASGDRGESTTGTSGLVATVGIFDSAGTIAATSHSETGTISYTPSRLNGWIGILNAESGNAHQHDASDTVTLHDQVTTDLSGSSVFTENVSDTLGLSDGAVPQNSSDRFTDRLNIYKAFAGETINVEQDLNENWDLIDSNFPFIECTSSTRPTATFAGMCILESDTGRTYVSRGTTPVEDSWIEIPNGGSQTGGVEGFSLVGLTEESDTVIISYVDNEDYNRFVVDADGTWRWGNGSNPVDTSLSRDTADTLTTSGSFEADSFMADSLVTTGTHDINTLESSTNISVDLGEVDPTFMVDSTGVMYFGEGSSPVDTHIRRDVDTGVVTTSGDLAVSGTFNISGVGQTRFARKTSFTARSNTTTLAADPDLTLTVDADSTYEVEMWLVVFADVNCEFNSNWSMPASADGYKSCLGATNVDASNDNRLDTNVRTGIHFFSTETEYETDFDGQSQWVYERGIVSTGSTSGSISLQWAQKNAVVGNLYLGSNSYMKVTKVE